jgi:hypothetical protein
MIVQVIGKQALDFTTKEGQLIKGTNLYVAYKEENTEGLKADRFFVRDGVVIPKEMKINDKLDIGFNNRGKIEAINLMK